eukprot:c16474_g1_i1.p1 GENE.c16474_g1_i1~~c16474_g1_i1.p1  ORF type:complete len:247 (+),score=55.38 c16474_g1_i1:44-784(+)
MLRSLSLATLSQANALNLAAGRAEFYDKMLFQVSQCVNNLSGICVDLEETVNRLERTNQEHMSSDEAAEVAVIESKFSEISHRLSESVNQLRCAQVKCVQQFDSKSSTPVIQMDNSQQHQEQIAQLHNILRDIQALQVQLTTLPPPSPPDSTSQQQTLAVYKSRITYYKAAISNHKQQRTTITPPTSSPSLFSKLLTSLAAQPFLCVVLALSQRIFRVRSWLMRVWVWAWMFFFSTTKKKRTKSRR